MAKIGYARISSASQKIDRQIEQLKKSGCTKIFQDTFSGEHLNRPGLKEMIEFLRDDDILIISELDRLSRNQDHLTMLLDEIKKKKVTLDILNFPSFSGITDRALRELLTNLIIEVFKYKAESERKSIRERQQQGIELAKANGRYKGRKKKFSAEDPRLLHAIALKKEGKNVREISNLTNIPYATLYRYLKESRD